MKTKTSAKEVEVINVSHSKMLAILSNIVLSSRFKASISINNHAWIYRIQINERVTSSSLQRMWCSKPILTKWDGLDPSERHPIITNLRSAPHVDPNLTPWQRKVAVLSDRKWRSTGWDLTLTGRHQNSRRWAPNSTESAERRSCHVRLKLPRNAALIHKTFRTTNNNYQPRCWTVWILIPRSLTVLTNPDLALTLRPTECWRKVLIPK